MTWIATEGWQHVYVLKRINSVFGTTIKCVSK